jgi:hypothetical protein
VLVLRQRGAVTMGSLNFSASKDRVVVEIHAEGDSYGHDGCDSTDCHWTPDGRETVYLSIDDAKKLRRDLDDAIKKVARAVRS